MTTYHTAEGGEIRPGILIRSVTKGALYELRYSPRKVVYIEKPNKWGLLDKQGFVELIEDMPLERTEFYYAGRCSYD